MQYKKCYFSGLIIMALLVGSLPAQAEVTHYQKSPLRKMTYVADDPWQPKDFDNGTVVPAVYVAHPLIELDGKDDEAAWSKTHEMTMPLAYGTVKQASLKALYTDEEVYIRVRWADSSENREHHPWIWDRENKTYVAGPQVEDSLLLSFEAGCEWTPSLLGGYIYDFDGWYWLAARSDPLAQALDTLGSVQDREIKNLGFEKYPSRVSKDDWLLKFIDASKSKMHAKWDQLERAYMLQPVTNTLYVRVQPDGLGLPGTPTFVEQVAAPVGIPDPSDESTTFPQYIPVKLKGGAGEVKAKGGWENGFWTVEFRRKLTTPAKEMNDVVFNRLTQFSVHVFDQAEKFDQASESKRLFLQFLPKNQTLVSN